MSTHNNAAFWASLGVTAITALWGSSYSMKAVHGPNSWYNTINKPSWNPPPVLFSVMWTILFVILVFVGYVAFKSEKRLIIEVFGINLLLNLLWSYAFFELHDMNLAIIINIVMIVVLIWLMRLIRALKTRESQYAYLLLWALLIWLVFALFISISVANMNP